MRCFERASWNTNLKTQTFCCRFLSNFEPTPPCNGQSGHEKRLLACFNACYELCWFERQPWENTFSSSVALNHCYIKTGCGWAATSASIWFVSNRLGQSDVGKRRRGPILAQDRLSSLRSSAVISYSRRLTLSGYLGNWGLSPRVLSRRLMFEKRLSEEKLGNLFGQLCTYLILEWNRNFVKATFGALLTNCGEIKTDAKFRYIVLIACIAVITLKERQVCGRASSTVHVTGTWQHASDEHREQFVGQVALKAK